MTKLLFIPEYRWHREYESFTANPVDVNVAQIKPFRHLHLELLSQSDL